MRISLRYKFLSVLAFLLLLAVGFYTGLASLIFRDEKLSLLFDLNHSVAVNVASQLRSSLLQTSDQLKLFVLSEVLSDRGEVRLPADFFQSSHIVGTRLFKKAPKDLVNDNLFVEMKTSGKLPPMTLEKTQLVPLLKEADTQGIAFRSTNEPNTSPRFFLVTKIEIKMGKEAELYYPVAELEGRPFFETLQNSNVFKAYLTNVNGEVLLHCNRSDMASSPAITDHPLLKDFTGDKQKHSQTGAREFDYRGEQWLGAFAPLGIGNLIFISQANRKEIYSAVYYLLERSAIFGLIVLTVTFIGSVLFSKGLTRNLRLLTEGAKQIGAGDLKAKIEIRSRDEVSELASSFNAMVDALRSSREAIEKYNRELETKVEERTAQLHDINARIKEVQEKLLKTTQLAAVGEMAGRTAHEVLNPLTAILSRVDRSRGVVRNEEALPQQFSEILGAWEGDFRKGGMASLAQSLENPSTVHPELSLFEEDLDNLKKLAHYWRHQTEVLGQDLVFVQDQAERIHRIIDGMRELVRSSAKANIDCSSAITEAVATMADFISKQGIKLKQELMAKNFLAVANRDEFIQILTNLIRNAFQAILSKGDPQTWKKGTITVSAHGEETLLLIDVIDNGPGIPEDKRSLLFEHGFTTKGPKEGTGIGLSICRRYAHAFGGEVNLLYSEPGGRGTCFRVTVPLKHEPAAILGGEPSSSVEAA